MRKFVTALLAAFLLSVVGTGTAMAQDEGKRKPGAHRQDGKKGDHRKGKRKGKKGRKHNKKRGGKQNKKHGKKHRKHNK